MFKKDRIDVNEELNTFIQFVNTSILNYPSLKIIFLIIMSFKFVISQLIKNEFKL